MSISKEAAKWHQVYEMLDDATKSTIDAACEVAREKLRPICDPAYDDRAEEFVAAITKYYKESLRK